MPVGASRRPTLKDVAQIARVDVSVVSRVISKDPGLSIQDATRQRVIEAIEQLNYRPSIAGRGLRTQRLYTLGIVMRDMTSPFDEFVFAAISQRAAQTGYALIVTSDSELVRPSQEIAGVLPEDRVDGLLIVSSRPDEELRQALSSISKPVVVVDRRLDGFVTVNADDRRAAEIATEHLIGLGHRRIAHLALPIGVEVADRRREGFLRVVADRPGVSSNLVVHADAYTPDSGYVATMKMLSRLNGHTAVLCDNGNLALGFYRAAYEKGLRIPDDISVVAIHHSQLAELFVPSLTTVALPLSQMAQRGLDLLIGMVETRPVEEEFLVAEPELHPRQSTGKPRPRL